MGKRMLHFVLAVLMIVSLALPVGAKNSDEVKVRKVEMSMDTLTVRVNQTRTLWALVTPSNADDKTLDWESSNPEVAAVDGDGEVTGISPGTTEVTVTSANGKTAVCLVTVPGTVLKEIETDTTNKSRPEAAIDGGETLSAAKLRVDVESAVKSAKKGETATVTYKDKSSVSTAALRGAAYTAEYGGGEAALKFITSGEGKTNQGQLTIRPQDAPSEDGKIRLGVYTDAKHTDTAAQKAKKKFGNAAVVKLEHSGGYGMSVQVAALVDLKDLNTDTLRLYRYDSNEEIYTLLEDQSYSLTQKGYLVFNTTRGGFIVVTDKASAGE